MKQLLVDYHFHPNLSKNDWRARQKCQRIWEQFSTKQLSVVVITEHVFKNPARAFSLLQETKPKDATTVIYPGVEALTSEGIDILIFAEHPEDIYDHRSIMVPKQLSAFGMIDYINRFDTLFGSIAHPFSAGNSGMVNRIGVEKTMRAIKQLGGVEIHNTCFRGANKISDKTGLSKIFKHKRKFAEWTHTVPGEYYHFPTTKLLTAGSDAHVLVEIGSGMLIPVPDTFTPAELFYNISHNTSEELKETNEKIYFWLGLYKIYSVVSETLTKAFRLYEGKVYQQDDQFTNFYSEAEKETILFIRNKRSKLLKPLLNFLTYFGITPNELNIVSAISVFYSFFIAADHPIAASIIFIIFIFTSIITGALARYQESDNESAAMTKVAMQYIVLFSAILAIIWFEWAEPFWAALYLGMYTILLALLIRLNELGQPIRLVIRSKYFIITAIFVHLLTTFNIVNELLAVFALYMVTANVWMLFRLRRTLNTNKSLTHNTP